MTEFWTSLAKAKRSEWTNIAQSLVDDVTLRLGEEHLDDFVVDAALINVTVGLKWHMGHRDSIEDGLNPFIFNETDLATAREMARANPSLSDALATLKSTFVLPLASNSNRYIRRVEIWMHVVLGDDHPVVSYLANHYRNMESFRWEYVSWRSSNPSLNQSINGILHLKKIALGLSYYFRAQALQPNAQPLYRFSNCIQQEQPWNPILSETFITKYKIRELCMPPRDSSAGTADGAGGNSLTAPPTIPIGNSTGRVANLNYEAAKFGVYKERNIKTKLVRSLITKNKIRTLPTSKVDQGAMYLA